MSSACELVSTFSSNCSKSAALIEMDSVTALVDLVSNDGILVTYSKVLVFKIAIPLDPRVLRSTSFTLSDAATIDVANLTTTYTYNE